MNAITLNLDYRQNNLLMGIYNSYQDYAELDSVNIQPEGAIYTIATQEHFDFLVERLKEVYSGVWNSEKGKEVYPRIARKTLNQLGVAGYEPRTKKSKLQPVKDAMQTLADNIEVLPPLSSGEQWVLNRFLNVRSELSQAYVNADDTELRKLIEAALYANQECIKKMGGK